MKFLDILFEVYSVIFTVVAAYAVALSPFIIVMVFEISRWWAMLMFITVPIGVAMLVCMLCGF